MYDCVFHAGGVRPTGGVRACARACVRASERARACASNLSAQLIHAACCLCVFGPHGLAMLLLALCAVSSPSSLGIAVVWFPPAEIVFPQEIRNARRRIRVSRSVWRLLRSSLLLSADRMSRGARAGDPLHATLAPSDGFPWQRSMFGRMHLFGVECSFLHAGLLVCSAQTGEAARQIPRQAQMLTSALGWDVSRRTLHGALLRRGNDKKRACCLQAQAQGRAQRRYSPLLLLPAYSTLAKKSKVF